ncbi:MarR family winged helix-turn-helix transcriptional regulator [Proteus myxofaciens]|uniref:MarR family transcriptional regulator n=1 Tax=Proteus myxofaciens ATCC 19692 TaxID=1354337 RepID=A0A198FNF9_9GAMM|nr:winged helix DNA-binding protein [Proteus myxofaciens]OAT26487.1 MarR family transcriptional regulator [Proteus myxofaciens ATCC 19692]
MKKEKVTTKTLIKSVSDFLQLKDEYNNEAYKKLLEKNGLEKYSLSELHVIHCIGEESMRNLTTISEYMSMTRGAVSKICQRLQTKGAIEKVKMVDNQKEVFFILTAEGLRLFQTHEVLHQQSEAKWEALLDKYNHDEKVIIQRFIEDVISQLRR